MLSIPEVTDLDLAFPVDVPLPSWDIIPKDFKRCSNEFAEVASTLFFKGGNPSDFGLRPKQGVDNTKALRAIRCCLGSFEPKHEHKKAGVAYMLSEWFEK